MLFPTHMTTRRGPYRFTVLQLNTLGRFDEPLDLIVRRQRSLIDFVAAARPSIAALQEVPPSATALEGKALNIVDALTAAKGDGGEGLGFYKSICYAKNTPRGDMGCLVFDDRVFDLVSEERFQFGVTADSAEQTSQFAIIAVLRFKEHPSRSAPAPDADIHNCLLVVAQHAKAGRNEKCEAIRVDHSRQLLSYLTNPAATEAGRVGGRDSSVSESTHSHLIPSFSSCSTPSSSLYPQLVRAGRLVWAGDMNAGPHSYAPTHQWPCEWYERVVRGRVGNGSVGPDQWVNKEVPLLSTMTIAHGGDEPPYTTFKRRDGALIAQTIDYIFVSRASRCLSLMGVSSPATAFASVDGVAGASCALPTLPVEEGFPNKDWGSDHLPLLCELEFREAPAPPTVASSSRCDRD